MKKLLFLVGFVFVMTGVYAQYNDTLYYKSGMVKAVNVKKYDDFYVFYEYRSKKGKLVDNRQDRSALKHFVIYNEFNELTFNSQTGFKKEEPAEETEEKTEE